MHTNKLVLACALALAGCKPTSSFTGSSGKAGKAATPGGSTAGGNPGKGAGGTGGKDDDDDVNEGGNTGKGTGGGNAGKGTGGTAGGNPGKSTGGNGGNTGGTNGKLGSGVDSSGNGTATGGGIDSGAGTKGKPDAGGLLIEDGGKPCLDKIAPLHIMIALDVTGSMDSNIDAVRSNILSFAQTVRTIVPEGGKTAIPEVKIGAILYEDDVGDQQMIALTDPASFASELGSVSARGGIHDHCEGGISAVQNALVALSQAGGSTGAVPMLLVISDNYSHDSMNPSGSRTFDMSMPIASAKHPAMKNLLFFDAVPTTSDVPGFTECPGVDFSKTPAQQWEPVRDAWKQAHPEALTAPGRNLGFPFTSATLLQTLPSELKRLLKICGKG